MGWMKNTLKSAGEVVGTVCNAVRSIPAKVYKTAGAIAATIGGFASMSSARAEDVTLPAMPVDFPAYATSGMTTVGTIMGAIAGIIIILALVNLGFKKVGGALSGKKS